jgi:hypothetical protein
MMISDVSKQVPTRGVSDIFILYKTPPMEQPTARALISSHPALPASDGGYQDRIRRAWTNLY